MIDKNRKSCAKIVVVTTCTASSMRESSPILRAWVVEQNSLGWNAGFTI